jgi:hypothetical protein
MEERSLKVIAPDTTFFNKISNTLTKILMPTKIGLNGFLINIKRNNAIKAFENIENITDETDSNKKDQLNNRFEESYTLYLESIDKYIMDSIYKKVKSGTASSFERESLSKYYDIVHLKENEYLEYKYQKQRFLLAVDYENVLSNEKEKVIERYEKLYIKKVDSLYKGILKHYSVKLADGQKNKNDDAVVIYKNIFSVLEEYIKEVLPIKFKIENKENYSKIIAEYEEYEKFSVGKLDEKDFLEKNMILLGLSRVLFTHSLPLVAAEQCYNKLLRDTRNLIMNLKNETKREEAYQMLLKLIEDYNVKLLSTKVYWDKPEEREVYKKFWADYSKAKTSEEKEILSLKRELYDLRNASEKYDKIRSYYKSKLVDLGVMRKLQNSATTGSSAKYIKVK